MCERREEEPYGIEDGEPPDVRYPILWVACSACDAALPRLSGSAAYGFDTIAACVGAASEH